jgi:hypothetical protein
MDPNSNCVTVFEEEASSWEEKLNRVNVLFGESASINLRICSVTGLRCVD